MTGLGPVTDHRDTTSQPLRSSVRPGVVGELICDGPRHTGDGRIDPSSSRGYSGTSLDFWPVAAIPEQDCATQYSPECTGASCGVGRDQRAGNVTSDVFVT